MRLEKIPNLLQEAISEWLKDDASLLAAALAYYGLFAFVPLLILVLIFINSLFQYGFLDGNVVHQAQALAVQQMPRVAGELIAWAGNQAASFRLTIVSLLLLILGAGGLFVQTKRAFHIIWRLPDEERPLVNTIQSYLRSLLLIGLVAFLLLVTSIFSALLLPAGKQIEESLPIHLGLLRLITLLGSISFVTLLFAVVYKTLVEVKLKWRDVLPGSALAADLICIRKLLHRGICGICQYRIGLWSSRIAGCLPLLDLLLSADLHLRGRGDQGAQENFTTGHQIT